MKKKLATLITATLLTSIIYAQELTTENYVNLEITAKTLTNQSMAALLAIEINDPQADQKEAQIQENTYQQIQQQYQQYQITPLQHFRYATKHRQQIDQWLQQHTEQQQQLIVINDNYEKLKNDLFQKSQQAQQ